METRRPRPNLSLPPSFDVHRELGGGGMSRVFLATDRELGREVVVKTLPSDIMSHDSVERFKREIRTSARLQHPNIVPLLSAGEADGVPYYTMPWVDGPSLRERLQRGPIPLPEGVSLLRDIARALAAAHGASIIHRDIKPENVLISADSALVTDFGVARALREATGVGGATFNTGTGIAVGTPAYMAPEQFAADPSINHLADLYAWGVVAYEVITGQHPFAGLHGTALLQAHMDKRPERVDRIAPATPRPIVEIIAKCLEKDPAQRPANAQQLIEALDAQAISSPRAAASRSRRRIIWAVVAALVAIIAIPLIFLYMRPGVAANDRMIAVAPFRVGGASTEMRFLREGLPDLMTPQLQSIPGVSATSVRVLFEQWRRDAGSVDEDLPDDGAIRVAERSGAGQIILGDVVGTGDRVTINARLIRVRDGEVLAPASVDGSPDSAAALAARLVATLLSVRDGATLEQVRTVVSARPEAILPFLAGEQSYRRGRYSDAAVSYARAFEQDTTFALAALRSHIMIGWNILNPITGPWLERAYRHRDRLRGGDAALLLALTGPAYPAPRTNRVYSDALWSAARDANTAELWYFAADILMHRYTIGGDTLAWHRALDGFRKAEALDSSFAPALEHQAALYDVFGDTASARAAWRRQRALDSTGDFFIASDLLTRSMGGDEEAAVVRREFLARKNRLTLLMPQVLMSDIPSSLSWEKRFERVELLLSEAGPNRELGSSDPNVWLAVAAHAMNSGRPRAFSGPGGRDSALFLNAMNVVAGVLWDGLNDAALRSAVELRSLTTSPDSTVTLMRSFALFARGLWAMNSGDSAEVSRARAGLLALRPPSDRPWLGKTPEVHEKLLAAHLAVARKAPDARTRLEELDSLLFDVPLSYNFVALPGNLVVSRLWEELGDNERAWATVQRRHGHVGAAAYASSRLRSRARIAERLGRREDAIEALRAFIAMRAKADPHLQAEVAEMRERLARLERESRGR